jgi:hypothetical protein
MFGRPVVHPAKPRQRQLQRRPPLRRKGTVDTSTWPSTPPRHAERFAITPYLPTPGSAPTPCASSMTARLGSGANAALNVSTRCLRR